MAGCLVGWFELMILSTLCCLPQKKKYVQSIIKAEFLMPHIVSVSKMMTDGFFRAHTISFNDLLQTFLTSLDDGVIYPKNRELMILSSAHKYIHIIDSWMNEWYDEEFLELVMNGKFILVISKIFPQDKSGSTFIWQIG